ncbi:BCS1 N terminal-domain-containing protein [Xylariomycetidae sp. FL0641]|nr:BCS1 N terminal-domain-containing protein [Xylariomycetidae sp. FL0641]
MATLFASFARADDEAVFSENASHVTPQAPQLALLDFFFPGFSIFAGAVQKYLHVDLNLYIPLVLLVGVLTVAWSYVSSYFWDSLESHFMSVVDIRTDDEIYNILMAWVATQRFSQGARRFVVNANLNSRSWACWRFYDDDDEDENEDDGDGRAPGEPKKKPLSYTPSFGSHYFWYRGRLLLFRRTAKEHNSFMTVSEREEISISCFGRNPWILKELLLEARQMYMERDKQKTLIYRGTTRGGSSEPTWQRCMARASRPFSTVILNEKTKQDLIEDVTDYLCLATQRWYANRGIPYRRGYLLYGPPGTGKSSLSLALAGYFQMRIYIVSLSSITANEENLASLFAELPRRCVVLLEDIDTAGLTHTRDENGHVVNPPADDAEPGQLTPGNGNTLAPPPQPSSRLSLSGLLNILDGVASQEGRVLIMTTNHLDKLDKALIRPGRVDTIVEFGLADDGMTASIFKAIFAHLEGDDGPAKHNQFLNVSPDARRAIQKEKEKGQAEHDAQINVLAEEFAAKIPAHEFSPAELQGHLMKHKRHPRRAIDTAEEFIEQTRKDRKEKELKAAEEKRKADEQKAEAAKKKADEDAKKKAEEEKEKEKRNAKDEGNKTSDGNNKEDAQKPDAVAAAPTTDKQQADSTGNGVPTPAKLDTKASDDPGHRKRDSGYVSPSDSEA